ncbi:polysaccharide deacetylase family protein [Salinisphaera hydrothermalis]|uniref:Putative hydrolase n=1 Tax=Salinisphaera hydrothermalis (strain C41B8) TaxID=1304275 RepID=A0A084IQR8_SALHC|nr:polysaccharide deacetylase family protein [Salinisphaera hydrothermalis]KEZ79052.1 putative hydrolase [Salinisphaera hydrothermalis C41B8]
MLLYHHVGRFARPARQLGLYCHADAFARQMAYLARSPLTVVSLDRALAAITGQAPLGAPSVVLTFDDGFEDFREYAWPVLRAHGFPATMFAVADRLGARADWLTSPSAGDDRLMDAATLRALADDGLDIGAHSATHPRLSRLPPAKRDAEIADARNRLQDALGRPVKHFAYPYGDYDADVRDRVAAAGFASALTCIRDRAERAANAYEIPREGISYKDGRLRYAYKTRWRHNRRR